MWVFGLTILVGLLFSSAALIAFLALVILALAVRIKAATLDKKANLAIESVDEEGFIRIARVDYETSLAIAGTSEVEAPQLGSH